MFSLIPLPYRLLGGAIATAVLLGGCVYYGWHLRDRDFSEYKLQVNSTAKAQAILTAQLNKKLKDNSDEAAKNVQIATQSIADYYKSHPVIRLRIKHGSCTVSTADSGSKGADGSTSAFYASPYTPESAEQVANRLDQLQKLLIKNGVTVK